MMCKSYFYACSPEYVERVSSSLPKEMPSIINALPKRSTQSEINQDLWWLLVDRGWCYDSKPAGLGSHPPDGLGLARSDSCMHNGNIRSLCKTTTTIAADWHSDFAKDYDGKLIQLEAQFGKMEAMFKDFCGFQLAYHERRLALGIEVVVCQPNVYFAHRRNAISGMAYFDIAEKTLTAIGLDCPIWLIGIEE